MVIKIFAIWDSKAEVFRYPQFRNETGLAVRDFTTAVNDPRNEIGLYPDEFSLFEVGKFDDQSGKVEALKAPVSLGLALSFKKQQVESQIIDMSNYAKKEEKNDK